MEIIATRKDFIDQYVGWSYRKTTEFLRENKNNKIIIDESEGSIYQNEHDAFGLEAIIAIKNFGSKIKFLNEEEDKLLYYFNITSSRPEDVFQKR